jgi:hypothetical protein
MKYSGPRRIRNIGSLPEHSPIENLFRGRSSFFSQTARQKNPNDKLFGMILVKLRVVDGGGAVRAYFRDAFKKHQIARTHVLPEA